MAKQKGSAKRAVPARPRRAGTGPFTIKFADILQSTGFTSEQAEAISKFTSLPEDHAVSTAREIIQNSIIDPVAAPDPRLPMAISASERLLTGYATLDDVHRGEITRLIAEITDYLKDPTRKRPLNSLMLASPGAGKSHFIKQLAKKMEPERVQAVTFNMANMQSHDDIAQPIDDLRNVKVNDRYPLLFLDEFDSDASRYASLLPLLWEGELHVRHRDLKLGKAVIVLAGSNPDLPKLMDQSAKMRIDGDIGDAPKATGKLIDLLSRINGGVINIPDLDLREENRDRRVDKICVAVSLLRGRFGEDLNQIPRALLRFIAHTKFRYGVRSIAHLIDVINSKACQKQALRLEMLKLPFAREDSLRESSFKLHLLDKDQAFGIVSRWKEFAKDKTMLDLRDPRERLSRAYWRRGLLT